MTMTAHSADNPEPSRPRSRIPRWVWWLAIVLVAVLLLASIASILVRNRVDARLASIGTRLHMELELGSITLSPFEGILLRDLKIRSGAGAPELEVDVSEIGVRLEARGLLSSAPRPQSLQVRGVTGHLDASPSALGHWLSRRAAATPESPEATAPGEPIALSLVDVQIIAHGPSHKAVGVLLRDVVAQGSLGGPDGHRLEGRAALAIGRAERQLTFAAETGEAQHLALAFDHPLGMEVDVSSASVGLATSGLSWSSEGDLLVLENTSLKIEERSLGCERLEVQGLEPFSTAFDRMNRVTCESVEVQDGARRIHAEELRLELTKPAPDVIVGGRVAIEEARLGGERDDFEARARLITARLVGDVLENARRGKLRGVIDTVVIQEPTMRLTLPEDTLGKALGEDLEPASAAIEEDAPDLRADDDPLPTRQDGPKPADPVGSPVVAKPFQIPFGERLVQHILEIGVTLQDGHMDLVVRETDPPLRIDDLELQLSEPRDPGAEGLQVAVSGLLHRAHSDAGRVSVSAHIAPDGSLASAVGEVSGTDFAHIISRFSDLVTVEPDSWVKLHFDYRFDPKLSGAHQAKGSLDLRSFGFQSWRVSHQTISGLQGRFEYEATYRPSLSQVDLRLPRIAIGDMRLKGEARISRPPDDGASYDLRLSMPRQDCGAVARSIPPALIPRLEGWELEGEMDFAARFTLDMDFIYGLTLDVDGDLTGCEALSLGEHVNVNELARYDWTHFPIEPERGRLEDVPVGPATPHWTSPSQIPLFVKAGAIVTEDRGFASHQGVRWDLIGKALRLDLHKERFVYGGSTITQQLVKNLFLTREKTLSRKLEELIVSWQMERHFSKEEILTFYLNVIEYGPDLYGIRRAAAFYFGKAPAHLTPAEGAFLMGLKPYPRAGYRQWERQKLNSWWVGRVKSVLTRMNTLQGAISAADVRAAAPYQIRFRRPGESLVSGRSRAHGLTDSPPVP